MPPKFGAAKSFGGSFFGGYDEADDDDKVMPRSNTHAAFDTRCKEHDKDIGTSRAK